jgi:hypothetical protein
MVNAAVVCLATQDLPRGAAGTERHAGVGGGASGRAGGGRRGPAAGRLQQRAGVGGAQEARFSDDGSLAGGQDVDAADAPGSLGAKLQELGRRLLQVCACMHACMHARQLSACVCAGPATYACVHGEL